MEETDDDEDVPEPTQLQGSQVLVNTDFWKWPPYARIYNAHLPSDPSPSSPSPKKKRKEPGAPNNSRVLVQRRVLGLGELCPAVERGL